MSEKGTDLRSQPLVAVWEEALLEELVYAIAHLAHAEQHLLEIDTAAGQPLLAPTIDKIRFHRKSLGEILFKLIGIEGSAGSDFRNKAESFWCVLKHLSMAMIHCDEVAEKLIKKMGALADKNATEELKEIVRSLIDVYRIRRETRDNIIRLLTRPPESLELKALARCREDLCVELER